MVSNQSIEKNSELELSSEHHASKTTDLLPQDSQDDYYNFIKARLICSDNGPRTLVDDRKYLESLVYEWLMDAPNLELTSSQKKLNEELLLSAVKDLGCDDYNHFLNLKQCLADNKNSEDLKTVFNLKRSKLGTTLLHVFVGQENMHDLLKAGADPNIQDNKGKTPLHDTALYHCKYEDVDCLLGLHANPNIQDREGKTPLHYYAAYCTSRSRKIMDLLVKNGADLSIKDNDGKTPLQIASDNNNIIECLLTDNQKKLYGRLLHLVNIESLDSDWDAPDPEQFENLKNFFNEHKNDEDLKTVLNVKINSGNSALINSYTLSAVKELLSQAGVTSLTKDEQDNFEGIRKNLVERWDSLLSNIIPPDRLAKIDQFLRQVLEAGSIAELQKVVNEAIISGIRLNFAKDQENYFTDHVIKRIRQLEKSPEVASDIICALISRGGKLKNSSSFEVINEIESGFKGHKANMIRAYNNYINYAKEFFTIAENAANGELNDARIDNSTFYLEYSEDSTIYVAKITDGARDLGLTQGEIECGRDIIKIGKSEVEIITQGRIRNYTDLAEDSDIVLTFYTSQGELEVRLYPDEQNKEQIKVEIKDQGLLESLKHCKEELGRNCLLGGLSVNKAIEQGYFFRSGKLSQPSETLSVNSSLGDVSLSSPIQESIQKVR
ncbi:ankyrin repeat domain-containing protein [Wolbachia endosymbiont (group A) of Bombylius major]|uniref:ankyrin repeat domain-containing protein n=1 Tax=Wolbachia endosymbiont (group A) of Bombylius major TaxID=2953988 RepID=UPI00223137B3|nr:ankyrin repeat domain-containing protein [Wolbachia endosymbiont (group A) of Bombylius major]